jgi:hypothetical protein
MRIVIPGAMPSLNVAKELAPLLAQRAPTLYRWWQLGTARVQAYDAQAHGCTHFEAWQLIHAGYSPATDLPLGAGLGPLLAGPACADGHAVWLLELVHLAVGTGQATLLHPALLNLQHAESQALFQAAQALLKDTDFSLTWLTQARWRLCLPAHLRPRTASPRAVVAHRLEDWSNQDVLMRPWRQRLNEIQMVWHSHPINQAREARGALTINGLWLYGGAAAWPIRQVNDALVLLDLEHAQQIGDWTAWLDALSHLDNRYLQPLAAANGLPKQAVELLLFGDDRRITLTLARRKGLLGWLPQPKKNGNAWWSHPN